ncbi:hypothetical protein [Alkalihalobacterium sp. APHAB7]|uniref:hypothetical protein n=1 Tax=Alkalihalobacterium sp. APHAB7 TaxID=3402081 RepID=UPI003AAB67DA
MVIIRREKLISKNEGWEKEILIPLSDNERHQAILSELTHEINNALTIVKETLQLYKAETKDQTTNTIIELSELNIIKISEILEEYNSYLGRTSKIEDINLVALIEELLIEYKDQLKFVNVITYFESRAPVVKGELNRLKFVLVTLFTIVLKRCHLEEHYVLV